VATIPSTTSAELLRRHDLPFIQAKNIEEAYKMFTMGQVEAVIYDKPVLQHLLNKEKNHNFKIIGNFEPQSYGILLPTGSPFRETINNGLLSVIESGKYREIQEKWFDYPE
jgi:ABC-type amino acid transport substrate-binding protein